MIYILNAIQTVKSSIYTWILRYQGKNPNTTYSTEGYQRAKGNMVEMKQMMLT